MSSVLQIRRGTTAQNNSFTGAVAELSVDTSTNTIRVHDAVTAGGTPIMPALRVTNAQRLTVTPQAGQVVFVTDYASAGVSPTWIGDGSTVGGVIAAGAVVSSASTATNVAGGTAGQILYQTGPGTSAFFGPGTTGQFLLSGGVSGPSYSSTLTYANGTVTVGSSKAATSTTTGALVVSGGMGIGGDVYIGGKIVAQELDIQYTTVTTTLIQTDDVIQTSNTTPTYSAATGALKVSGGIGIGGGGFFGGIVTATNFSGSLTGGTGGSIVYQSAANTTAFLSIGTNGYVLTSNGTVPTWSALGSLSAGNATTATNIAGGTAGQVPYQTAAGATSFYGPGSFGQFLMSGGTGAPSYSSTLTMSNGSINITGTANATTTQTGALIVTGGVGIGGDLQVGGGITAQGNIVANGNITLGNATTDTLIVGADIASDLNPDVTNTYNLGSGSLAWNRLYIKDVTASGTVTATTFVGNLTGTASNATTATSAATAYATIGTHTAGTGLSGTAFNGSANQTWTLNTATLMATSLNLAGGVGGQLHYQSAANASGFISTATTGNFLQANYNGAPTWTTTASMYVNRATVADSVANALTISTGLTGTAGTYNGSAAVTLTLNTATLMATSLNLAGGAAGSLPYQSGANATTMLGIGTNGYVLTSNGTAPVWSAASGITAGYAAQVQTTAQPVAGTYYPTFVSANNASATAMTEYTTSSLVVNPGTRQVGIGGSFISTSSILTVNGRIESLTDVAGEGGQLVLRGKSFYRWSLDNYLDSFRIIREDDVTEANGTTPFVINSATTIVIGGGNSSVSVVGEKLSVLGGIYSNGAITATTFVGALTGTASTATSAATAYATIGTHTAGTGLTGSTFNGSANQTWTLNTATLMATSVNLAGGSAGQFAYQTGANATAFISTGSMYVGNAAKVDTVAQVTSATYYPAFVDSNNAAAGSELIYTTSSVRINPSTGWLTADVFESNNNGNGTNFKVGDDAWIGDINTANTFRVTGQQAASNGYIVFGNGDTTSLGRSGTGPLTYGGNTIVHGGNTSTTYVGRSVTADATQAAVTFNNSNSGDASGITFNGGTARTVSANTLGALSLSSGGTVSGAVTFSGPVTFSGTATYSLSTQTYYTDNILELHVPPGGVNTNWNADDGKDIGFRFHYYTNSTDTNAALVLSNSNKWLEWYSSGAESTNTFVGSTYGNFRTGGVWATQNMGVGYTAAQVGEKLGINGGVYVNGIVTATTFVGALTGTASNATTATSAATAYATVGTHTAGTGLTGTAFNGSANQTWTLNTATLMQLSVNLAGGTAGQFAYQSASNTTAFISTGSMYVNRATIADSVANALTISTGLTGSVSTYNGSAAVTVSLNTATLMANAVTSINLANGVAGSLPYQSGVGTTTFLGIGTNGYVLTSNGTAPTWTALTGLSAGTASTATNLAGGTAGQVPYQTAGGSTSFFGPGTAGQILVSAGTSAPTYTNTASIYVNSSVYAEELRGGTAGAVVYQSAANLTDYTTTATTGNFLQANFNGAPTWTGTASMYVQNAVLATHQRGGTAGQLQYQSAADTTAFINTATTGNFLQSNFAGAPTWTTTASMYVQDASVSTNLRAGAGGSIPYQTGANATGFVSIGTNGQVLTSNGTAPVWANASGITAGSATTATSAATAYSTIGTLTAGTGLSGTAFNGSANQTWTLNTATLMATAVTAFTANKVANAHSAGTGLTGTAFDGSGAVTWTLNTATYMNSAVTANYLAGGAAGSLPYQSGAGTTTMLGIGTNGYVLTSNGSAPVWSAASGITAGYAAQVQTAAQTASATYYPTFVSANNASATAMSVYTTSTFTLNPASGAVGIAANSGGYALTISNSGSGSSDRLFINCTGSVNSFNIYENSQIPYINSYNSMAFRVNQLGGSSGNFVMTGGNIYHGQTSVTNTGVSGSNSLYTPALALGGVTTDSLYQRRWAYGQYQMQTTYAGTNGGYLGLQPYGGSVMVGGSGNTSTNVFEVQGTSGQLFSVSDSFTGTIFSVNDVSGIPSIEVIDTGLVKIAQYNGQVAINTSTAQTLQGLTVNTNTYIMSLGIGTVASGTTGEIRATNEITAYYSDRRLKENVQVIDNAVTKVLSLNGITYTPNELAESFGYSRTTKLVGLFADEVEAVLPEATRPAPFDTDELGNSKSGENYKTIQYEKVVPLLVEAIKEQQKTIETLMSDIETLKGQIASIKPNV